MQGFFLWESDPRARAREDGCDAKVVVGVRESEDDVAMMQRLCAASPDGDTKRAVLPASHLLRLLREGSTELVAHPSGTSEARARASLGWFAARQPRVWFSARVSRCLAGRRAGSGRGRCRW